MIIYCEEPMVRMNGFACLWSTPSSILQATWSWTYSCSIVKDRENLHASCHCFVWLWQHHLSCGCWGQVMTYLLLIKLRLVPCHIRVGLFEALQVVLAKTSEGFIGCSVCQGWNNQFEISQLPSLLLFHVRCCNYLNSMVAFTLVMLFQRCANMVMKPISKCEFFSMIGFGHPQFIDQDWTNLLDYKCAH